MSSLEQHLSNQVSLWPIPLLPAITGIGLHHGLFIHGEWHLHGAKIFYCHLLAAFVYYYYLISWQSQATPAAAAETVISLGCYTVAIFSSIVTYRLFFHPLSRAGFSGPRLAPVSQFFHAWACRDSKDFLYLDGLARQYGDFVRTGPSELMVTHPDVHHIIDGPGSRCIKADWYDITHPQVSLVTTRDPKLHEHRRRLWDKGFSTKALAQYRLRIAKYISMLDNLIEADVMAGRSTAIGTKFSWFAFDFMGDFCFGHSFDLLQKQEWHSVVIKIQEAMNLIGPTTPLPWLVHLGFDTLPFLKQVRTWFSMIEWCREQMEVKVQNSQEDDSNHEVSRWLIEEARNNGFTEGDWKWLTGDAVLAVVAGSHPIMATLTCLFYRLACHPAHAEKLQKELENVDCLDDHSLQTLPHLNAVIQETLRLHPPLISAGMRKAPKAGIRIGDTFIPGGTTIIAPRYTIFRRKDCFPNPHSFIPERWTERPDLVKNKIGFDPFGTGRYNCVGKNLGMTQVRMVTAKLLQKYDVTFCDDVTEGSFPGQVLDNFVANVGGLEVRLRRRG